MPDTPIKAIIFDLDGVLVDARDVHMDAFVRAVNEVAPNLAFDVYGMDGISTRQKLSLLTDMYGLDPSLYDTIDKRKQEFTKSILENSIHRNDELIDVLEYAKSRGCEKFALCSNARRETVELCLRQLEIRDYFDVVLSNEDIKYRKPDPYIYFQARKLLGTNIDNTLIIEDSYVGRCAARDSLNIHIGTVFNCEDVTVEYMQYMLDSCNEFPPLSYLPIPFPARPATVLMPMAGEGSRFRDAGYTVPKPFIPLDDSRPMFYRVVRCLDYAAKYVFLVRKEHVPMIEGILQTYSLFPYEIVVVDHTTEGAACTTLLAKEHINNNYPLIIANCDQLVDWNSGQFIGDAITKRADGAIALFHASDKKWSFAELDDHGVVKRVAEKDPISNNATCGMYLWRRGSDYVKYAEQMIKKNIRVNNEFYVCPVYNEAIQDGKKIIGYFVEEMYGLGTPEDLERYLRSK